MTMMIKITETKRTPPPPSPKVSMEEAIPIGIVMAAPIRIQNKRGGMNCAKKYVPGELEVRKEMVLGASDMDIMGEDPARESMPTKAAMTT